MYRKIRSTSSNLLRGNKREKKDNLHGDILKPLLSKQVKQTWFLNKISIHFQVVLTDVNSINESEKILLFYLDWIYRRPRILVLKMFIFYFLRETNFKFKSLKRIP